MRVPSQEHLKNRQAARPSRRERLLTRLGHTIPADLQASTTVPAVEKLHPSRITSPLFRILDSTHKFSLVCLPTRDLYVHSNGSTALKSQAGVEFTVQHIYRRMIGFRSLTSSDFSIELSNRAKEVKKMEWESKGAEH